MNGIRVGVWIPCYKPWVRRNEVKELAVFAEKLGLRSLWVQDHLVAPLGDVASAPVERLHDWLNPDEYGNGEFSAVEYYGEENWWLDPYALWGFLAGVTETVELASCVVVLPYRHPIAQAKMLGTLDVLSDGRMLFGFGSGHVPAEFAALGVPYADRGRRTDEYIRAMKTLLSRPEAEFQGEFVRFPKVRSLIRPVQSPHPPFFVGGNSKRSIHRAVDLGEGWLPAHITPANLSPGIDYLRERAAVAGRTPPDTAVTVTWRLDDLQHPAPRGRRQVMSADEAAATIRAYEAIGVGRLAIDLPNPSLDVLMRQMHLLAEVVRQAAVPTT